MRVSLYASAGACPTYGDIIADHSGRHFPLRVVPGHMHCHTVLDVGVVTHNNMVDITCMHTTIKYIMACTSAPHLLLEHDLYCISPASCTGGIICSAVPLSTAPYQTEELVPSFTSPITQALGATKAPDLRTGRFPWNAWSV